MKTDIYTSVADRIMGLLRKGVIPWRKPWKSEAVMMLPLNAKTKEPYQGINIMLLWLQERKLPYWGTAKTWTEIGASLLPNEAPTEIYFYTFFTGKQGKRVPFIRSYEVYNLLQVKGCDHLRQNEVVAPSYGPAEEIIKNSGADIRVARKPYYDISGDVIYCPNRSSFRSAIAYYTTKLHELGHWTGNVKRLNRVFGKDEESREYAFEELVAEMTSCFLAAHLNIPEALDEMPQQASYIGRWLKDLEDDPKAIFRAASAAQRATKFLARFGGCEKPKKRKSAKIIKPPIALKDELCII